MNTKQLIEIVKNKFNTTNINEFKEMNYDNWFDLLDSKDNFYIVYKNGNIEKVSNNKTLIDFIDYESEPNYDEIYAIIKVTDKFVNVYYTNEQFVEFVDLLINCEF